MTTSMPSGNPASVSAISSKLLYDLCKYHARADSSALCGSADNAPATTSACPSNSIAIRCTPPINEPCPPPTIPACSFLCCICCFIGSPPEYDNLSQHLVRRQQNHRKLWLAHQ